MLIVAAMALAPRVSAAADCTLPDPLAFGTATGDATGTGDSAVVGCVAKATLADAASCNLKKAEGYTFTADVGTYTCPTGDTTDATTAMAATGCDADYFQASGTTAADIVCTKCPTGKTKAAASVAATGAPFSCAATTNSTAAPTAAPTTAPAAVASAAAGVGMGAAASSAAFAFFLASFY